MAQTTISERMAPWDELALASPGAGYSLNIVFIYQDTQTRLWAREVFERVAKLAGPESARATWWKIADLSEPGVLAGAVSTAMRADVIVVAIRAGEGLPLPFYVWMNGWLPHRLQQAGALVALLDIPENGKQQSDKLRDYLSAAAREARLDYLPEERTLPSEPSSLVPKQLRSASREGSAFGRASLALEPFLAGGARRQRAKR